MVGSTPLFQEGSLVATDSLLPHVDGDVAKAEYLRESLSGVIALHGFPVDPGGDGARAGPLRSKSLLASRGKRHCAAWQNMR